MYNKRNKTEKDVGKVKRQSRDYVSFSSSISRWTWTTSIRVHISLVESRGGN
jgi:hypothetical protein